MQAPRTHGQVAELASGIPAYVVDSDANAKWSVDADFDLDGFLGQPLVARVATVGRTGPSVRPLWYLWEGGAFWWLTGGWSKLGQLLERDSRVSLVVDTCDLDRGEVLQVTARGSAELHPFDAGRARRWGSRYLGPDERHWRRFQGGVFDDPTTRFVALEPTTPSTRPVVLTIPQEEARAGILPAISRLRAGATRGCLVRPARWNAR